MSMSVWVKTTMGCQVIEMFWIAGEHEETEMI